MPRRRATQVGAAVLAVVALGTAGVALGSGLGHSISIVHRTTTTQFHGASKRTARCPEGERTLGGGFSMPDGRNIAQESRPVKGGWRVETLSDAGDVTAYAICAPGQGLRLRRAVAAEHIDKGSVSLTAKCRAGSQPLSGGFAVVPPYTGGARGRVAIDTSRPHGPRAWRIHGRNDGASTLVRVYAVCAATRAVTIGGASHGRAFDGPGVGAVKASCGHGWTAVGGGFKSAPTAKRGNLPEVSSSFPPNGHSWQVTADALVKHPRLTAFAVCAR